jgi:hypothetical protein
LQFILMHFLPAHDSIELRLSIKMKFSFIKMLKLLGEKGENPWRNNDGNGNFFITLQVLARSM